MSDFLHLDAIQGISDARTKMYLKVNRGSTVANDTVVRQEFWQRFELCLKTGQNGGGV